MNISIGAINKIDEIFEKAYSENRNMLYEHEVYEMLEWVKLDVPKNILITDVNQVTEEMLLPYGEKIVIKVVSKDVIHKQKVGGVKIVNKHDAIFVQYVIDKMREEVLSHYPDKIIDIEGFLLVEYVEFTNSLGNELLIGIKSDRAFGPVITVSKGGDDAEFFAKSNCVCVAITVKKNIAGNDNSLIQDKEDENDYTEYEEFLDMEEARDSHEEIKERSPLGYSQNIYQREEEEFHTLNDLIYTDTNQPAWKDFIAALTIPGTTYWEDFKFDHFTIDEAHSDRNLSVESRRMELSLQGSERAARTERKLTHMRKTNPGCHYTASTGTALTNRMSEIFTWQRFMAPDHLKSVNIHCYDAWLATYGYQSTELEITPDLRNWEPRTRYRGYKNVPSLLSLFHNFTDNIVNEDLALNLPDIEGGKPQSILVERTPQLDEHAQEIWERVDRIQEGEVDPGEDNIISIMHGCKCRCF